MTADYKEKHEDRGPVALHVELTSSRIIPN